MSLQGTFFSFLIMLNSELCAWGVKPCAVYLTFQVKYPDFNSSTHCLYQRSPEFVLQKVQPIISVGLFAINYLLIINSSTQEKTDPLIIVSQKMFAFNFSTSKEDLYANVFFSTESS